MFRRLTGRRNFSILPRVHTSAGALFPIRWVPGPLSSDVKWPGRADDHTYQSVSQLDCVKL